MKKINLQNKFNKFNDHWTPKVIEEMNDYQFKLVKIKNDFTWHKHDDTDETFFVIEGKIGIEFEDETIELSMNLGVDPRHADQNVRGVIDLPNVTGKSIRVGVFDKGDKGIFYFVRKK